MCVYFALGEDVIYRNKPTALFCSNHSDEDDLPDALAAISSQSKMGKSTSSSSLDKQVQPPIYPPVKLIPPLIHSDLKLSF